MLIAGNWKMNGLRAEAERLVEALLAAGPQGVRLLVCPPTTLIGQVRALVGDGPIAVGGQDCHTEVTGAHTGDISAAMLADLGATHVIVGHSERRGGHGETSALVRAKTEAALAAGLVPIVCVGETKELHEAGRAREVVGAQIEESLPDGFEGVLAYEPIWAIGSGQAAGIGDIVEMHGFARRVLADRLGVRGARVPILYGGSVKPDNAGAILSQEEVGGALVGGASLDAAAFLGIARAAETACLPVR